MSESCLLDSLLDTRLLSKEIILLRITEGESNIDLSFSLSLTGEGENHGAGPDVEDKDTWPAVCHCPI